MAALIYVHDSGAKLYLGGRGEQPQGRATWVDVRAGVDFITDTHTAEMNIGAIGVYADWIESELSSGRDIFVFCNGGIERSPLVVAFYIAQKMDISIDNAYDIVISKKGDVMRRTVELLGSRYGCDMEE